MTAPNNHAASPAASAKAASATRHRPLTGPEIYGLAHQLARAIANNQLVLCRAVRDAQGRETDTGPSLAAADWRVKDGPVSYDDGAPEQLGVHLYLPAADLLSLARD